MQTQTEILQALADGRIDVGRAGRLLDELRQPTAGTAAGTQSQGTTSWAGIARGLAGAAGDLAQSAAMGLGQAARQHAGQAPGAAANPGGPQPVDHVVVRARGRRVRLVAEPGLAKVVVRGEHTLQRTGNRVEVEAEGDLVPSLDKFSMLKAAAGQKLRGSAGLDLAGLAQAAMGSTGVAKELVVRVPAGVEVDVDLTGGGLATEGLARIGRLRASAAGLRLSGLEQMRDARVQACHVVLQGGFGLRPSSVHVESGSLQLALDLDADVRVDVTSRMARIVWPTGHPSGSTSLVAGQGTGRLALDLVLAQATITTASGTSGPAEEPSPGDSSPDESPRQPDPAPTSGAAQDGDEEVLEGEIVD
ncbi:hypothetical protein [Luteococcus sp.]|uniref:hypothetical protein n=1 Tax=Luteococcus sp. TaxID=1969402 RepID=UPI003734FCE7